MRPFLRSPRASASRGHGPPASSFWWSSLSPEPCQESRTQGAEGGGRGVWPGRQVGERQSSAPELVGMRGVGTGHGGDGDGARGQGAPSRGLSPAGPLHPLCSPVQGCGPPFLLWEKIPGESTGCSRDMSHRGHPPTPGNGAPSLAGRAPHEEAAMGELSLALAAGTHLPAAVS